MDPAALEGLLKAIRDAVSGRHRSDEDMALPIFDPATSDNGADSWCHSIEELAREFGWSSIATVAKVWQHNHRPADVEASVRGSLERMGLDYIDLILMHWPMSISVDGVDDKIDYLETWSGFESVLKKGLVKSIGVSNFNLQQMERLLKNCQVKPVVNQVELNINLGQKDLVSYCQNNDVLCVAYTPFGGMMSGTGIGIDPNSRATKLDDPQLNSIAKKHEKTVGQVVLRYLYERGLAAIPKTLTKSRIIENASPFDFKFDASDIAVLEKYDNNYRVIRPTCMQNYDNYPFDKLDVDVPEIPTIFLKWEDGPKIDL